MFLLQPQNLLRIKMAKNLLELNDDVLITIFSNFNVSELCTVATTCTRLQFIARKVFSLYHKSNCLDLDVNEDVMGGEQILAVLQNFGDLSTNVKAEWQGCYQDEIFNSLVRHCTGPLERLEIRGIEKEYVTIDATPLFQNVKELILADSELTEFLSDAKQLTKLSLSAIYLSEVVKILSYDLPQLQSITLDMDIDWDADLTELKPILMRHTGLCEFVSKDCYFDDLSFVAELPELTQLSIGNLNRDKLELNPLETLQNLTTLKLCGEINYQQLMDCLKTSKSQESIDKLALNCCGPGDVIQLLGVLRRFTKLKHLTLTIYNKVDSSLLAGIHRLKKLRVLMIFADIGDMSFTGDDLVNLVHHLPHLEELTLGPGLKDSIELKKPTYLRICDIYRSRKHKLTIYDYDTGEDNEYLETKQHFAKCHQQDLVQLITALPRESCACCRKTIHYF